MLSKKAGCSVTVIIKVNRSIIITFIVLHGHFPTIINTTLVVKIIPVIQVILAVLDFVTVAWLHVWLKLWLQTCSPSGTVL